MPVDEGTKVDTCLIAEFSLKNLLLGLVFIQQKFDAVDGFEVSGSRLFEVYTGVTAFFL